MKHPPKDLMRVLRRSVEPAVGSRHSRLISFIIKLNLHDFRYEGGAPINSGLQITLPLDCSRCVFTRVLIGNSVQLFQA